MATLSSPPQSSCPDMLASQMITDATIAVDSGGDELGGRRKEVEDAGDDRVRQIAETALSSATAKMRALHDRSCRWRGRSRRRSGLGMGRTAKGMLDGTTRVGAELSLHIRRV